MIPIWTNGLTSLYHTNADRIPMADGSVHTVITSPPYWGQRDYNVPDGIGLEPSIRDWTDALVLVFREVGRVLRNDGTLWVNVGDAYVGGGKGLHSDGTRSHGELQRRSRGSLNSPSSRVNRSKRAPRGPGSGRWGGGHMQVDGLANKNLMGLPWRLAFALQDDGWILRSEIIWHKPNPMPQSVDDRPTSSHETIFLLSKRRRYFYDKLGFRLPAKITDRWPGIGPKHIALRHRGEVYENMGVHDEVNLRDVWTFPPQNRVHDHEAAFPEELARRCILLGTSARGVCAKCGAPWRRSGPDDWAPGCHCPHPADLVPAMVLDPFVGSGTTSAVAQMLGRRSVGIDLSEDYLLNIARPRIEGITLPMELGV